MRMDIHPELKALKAFRYPLSMPIVRASAIMRPIFRLSRPLDGIREERRVISGMDTTLLRPREPRGTIIDIHGGAFAFPAAPYSKKIASLYALSGFDVLMPDYPLIPSHSCIEAIERIAEMAEGIDGLKCLSGSSAGGFIALHAAANLSHKPALMLIYPVVQPESSTGSMQRFRSTPMWDSRKNRWMWEHAMPEGHPSPPDLSGIGRAFIETAEYDPLRDEGRDLCGRLMEAGASAVLSETKGTFHGYDMLWRKPYVQQLIGRRITWIGTI